MAHANHAEEKRGGARRLRAWHKKHSERHKRLTAIVDGAAVIVLATVVVSGSVAAWKAVTTPSLPFTVIAASDPAMMSYPPCRQVVFPGRWASPAPPSAPLTAESVSRWEGRHGGVDAVQTSVTIVLQGDSGNAVTITQPSVVLLRRAPAIKGQEAGLSGGCGAGVTYRVYNVDLDSARPVPELVKGGAPEPRITIGGDVIPEAATSGFTISDTDPEYFVVVGTTTDHYCTWEIQFGWTSMGKSGTVTVTNNGEPFETTGTANDPERFLVSGKWSKPASS